MGRSLRIGSIAFVAIAVVTPCWGQAAAVQQSWSVVCGGGAAGLDCRALQTVPMTNSGQASVAVRISPETKKPAMLILVPLAVYLPAGISIKFGEAQSKTVVFDNCDNAGCLAKYDVSEEELGQMAKGQAITLSVQDTNHRPISVKVPSVGFSAALGKIR